jgi:hypothetical protein
MEKMQGQAEIYKGGKLICRFSTLRYDSTNKSMAHIRGAITKRIKKEVKELNADYAEAYINYSVLPNGPFLTRGIGKVQP